MHTHSNNIINGLPDEILLQIFDAFCKLEFQDYSRRQGLQSAFASKARRLKPSLLPLSQVCSVWRSLILAVPSYYLTTISLYRYSQIQTRIQEIKQLLLLSADSDVDFFFSYNPLSNIPGTFDGIEWLKENVTNYKQRIRILEAMALPSSAVDQISRVIAGNWPKLQALLLGFSGECTSSLPEIVMPNLSCVNFRGVVWEGSSAFQDLSTLKLMRGESEFVNSGQSATPFTQIHNQISCSSSTLTTLILRIKSLDFSSNAEICVPTLRKLAFSSILLENLSRFLKLLKAPRLEELSVEARTLGDSVFMEGPAIVFLERVKRLSLHMSPKCFPPFFERVALPYVSDMVLEADHQIPMHSLDRPHIHGLPYHFPMLENLSVSWFQRSYGHEQASWFFSYFNFSNTSNHASLSLGFRFVRDMVKFALVTKFTCSSFDDLQQVALPSLLHLRLIGISAASIEMSGSKLRKAAFVPFEKVVILEAEGWLINHMLDLSDFARQFPNVSELIIHPLIFPLFNERVQNFIPTTEHSISFWDVLELKRPLMPKLNSLNLISDNNSINLSGSYAITQEPLLAIKHAILARRRLSYPIRTVRFNSDHPFGLSGIDMGWFWSSVEKVEFFRDKSSDFSWYSNYYPYEK